jgi:predicted ArsR family transcriptional regulator
VKNVGGVASVTTTHPAGSGEPGPDGRARDRRTRDAVTQLLLERGPVTAAELGEALGLSPAAIRRHLDAMLVEGLVTDRDRPVRGRRGRGRPAREFALTDSGRVTCGTHTYDDLAAAALRWIYRQGGLDAVSAFVSEQVAALEERCRVAMEDAGDDPLARAEGLARALSAEGYAASASALAAGGQLCQHHCPVAHVAAEFPQLCEAETQVISRLVGTHVQRLATIANGDGVCTTYIPDPRKVRKVAGGSIQESTSLDRKSPAKRNSGYVDRDHDDPNPVRMR